MRFLNFSPSAIVHCSGSGGTQAGLAIGASICLPHTRVVGIDIDAEPARVRADVIAYAREPARLLEIPFREETVEVVAGKAGPAYGTPHTATIDAIKLAARLEALVLDPVYAGKGLAGLCALIQEHRRAPEDNVIFVHTGGAPALLRTASCWICRRRASLLLL